MRSTITLSKRSAVFATVLALLLLPATPVLCQIGFAAGFCGEQLAATTPAPSLAPCHGGSDSEPSSEPATPAPECCSLLSMPATEAPADVLPPTAAAPTPELPVATAEVLGPPPTSPTASPQRISGALSPPLYTLHSSLIL